MVFNHEWSRNLHGDGQCVVLAADHECAAAPYRCAYAAKTEWGKPLVNSLFTLGLMIGMSVNDTTFGTTLAISA